MCIKQGCPTQPPTTQPPSISEFVTETSNIKTYTDSEANNNSFIKPYFISVEYSFLNILEDLFKVNNFPYKSPTVLKIVLNTTKVIGIDTGNKTKEFSYTIVGSDSAESVILLVK